MDRKTLDRRDVLKATAAAGAVGLTTGAHAAGLPAYDPNATFDLVVSEVELRRNTAGRMLMARIYQPKGPGPSPPFSTCMAAPGTARTVSPKSRWIARWRRAALLVVAVDMTIAPEAPYPACMLDANSVGALAEGERGQWNGDGSTIGVYGSSSGGHVAELLALRPHDQRYGAIPLAARRTSTPPSPGWRCARPSATPSRATRMPSGARTKA